MNHVLNRSPSLQGNRNGSIKESLPRMENHNSGKKTPKKSINIGRTLGNVLHDVLILFPFLFSLLKFAALQL
jgi:hypothetical protein